MLKRKPLPVRQHHGDNVVNLRQRVMPRHKALLARWLDAGRRMGLCDASAFHPVGDEPGGDYVLVWVRENPDPAYMVVPEAMHWTVTDCLRRQALARLPSFVEALQFIRPVLPNQSAVEFGAQTWTTPRGQEGA